MAAKTNNLFWKGGGGGVAMATLNVILSIVTAKRKMALSRLLTVNYLFFSHFVCDGRKVHTLALAGTRRVNTNFNSEREQS